MLHLTSPTPHPWQRVIQKLAATRPAGWLLAKVLRPSDRWLMKRTGGRQSLTTLLTGLPVVLVMTRGARSGQPRRVPLIPLVDGEAVILIASAFGSPHHPAWYHNLRAYPQATLSINGESGIYRARPATAAEWSRYWRMAVETYPGYATYRARCQNREIPILVLTPEPRPKDEI